MTAELPPLQPTIQTTLRGCLLIAMPTLRDPNFHRMVTLIVAHDENGAFGVVLGPATNTAAQEISEPFNLHWQRQGTEPVRYGGPCERARIWLLHGGEQPLQDATTIAPGVHLGSSPGLLSALNDHPDVPMMVFSGYAGWAPGQIEQEMQGKSWLPGEVTPALIFETPPDDVWEQALRFCDLSPSFIGSGHGASA